MVSGSLWELTQVNILSHVDRTIVVGVEILIYLLKIAWVVRTEDAHIKPVQQRVLYVILQSAEVFWRIEEDIFSHGQRAIVIILGVVASDR